MSIQPSASVGSSSNEDLLSVVKYSLPALLAELKLERATGSFAQEKLQQSEIGKLFNAKPKRRRAKRPV